MPFWSPGFVATWMAISATFAAILGIVGVVLATADLENSMSWPVKDYMYFGKIGRAQGLVAGPNMPASILIAGILLLTGLCCDSIEN